LEDHIEAGEGAQEGNLELAKSGARTTAGEHKGSQRGRPCHPKRFSEGKKENLRFCRRCAGWKRGGGSERRGRGGCRYYQTVIPCSGAAIKEKGKIYYCVPHKMMAAAPPEREYMNRKETRYRREIQTVRRATLQKKGKILFIPADQRGHAHRSTGKAYPGKESVASGSGERHLREGGERKRIIISVSRQRDSPTHGSCRPSHSGSF